jgi:hypothetical protein
MAYGLQTYWDTGRREDLLDVMGDVSPDETPLLTLFGTSTAQSTLHEWMTWSVARPTSVTGALEGADFAEADLAQPTRVSNLTQILTQPIRVSRTERKSNVAAMGDPFAFQKSEGLRQLKMKMEYAILRNGVKVSGDTDTVRYACGIDGFITTLATARDSGTSFSETELNDMVADAWNIVDPEKVFDMVVCTFKIKQAIAGFSGNSTRYIDATERRLVKDVLVYDSAGGSHRIFAHKDVRNTAGTTTVYGIREDMFRVAYFDKPFFQEIAKVGDSDRGQWVTEFTLECLAETASQKRTGYNQNG